MNVAGAAHPGNSEPANGEQGNPKPGNGEQGNPEPGGAHAGEPEHGHERGSGTVLAAGLGMVVMLAMVLMLLLAQSAVMASRAAAAADLAALAAADALRGISQGVPCSVAADVAGRQGARITSCTEGGSDTVEVRTELLNRSMFGVATGHARAGPPP
ncbi:secretion/DNA translocation related TadE-like protein [Arthrobacter sp. PvP023]|uniref:Rv3654c family TadE-like protein n=1 Tax=Pseudarthrobacter sp. PvP022 TaxID=3156433 RepID=UPI001B7B2169|nr:secretion/DNA translocation related TadE-like protein [Arthrobacter sp. PvP023]